MKKFSDSNTATQQTRRAGAEFKRRVELLRQWSGDIAERTSATVIKVSGDATSLLAVGDVFVIPLDDFSGNHTITSISHSGGITTITCSGSSFSASGLVGLQIAKRYTVSGGNVERLIEMSTIRFQTEGETLNEFVASDVDLAFWNADGFFSNSSGTGICNGAPIIWVRIYFGWKNSTDRVLYFGGFVQRNMIKDDRYAKTFTVTAFGHAKELERYPAYLISEANGDFLRLSGFEIVSLTANDQTFAGVKKLEWTFSSRSLPGIEITSISKNLGNGLLPLKFRFPNLFKYAWGNWTAVNENTASTDLTGADGSVLTIRTSNFDVQDREVFLQVVSDVSAQVEKSGEIEVRFDNGPAHKISSDFDAVISYDGTNYADESNDNDREGLTFAVFDDASSALYLFSLEPFYGIEVILDDSDLVAAIDISFSNGLDSWVSIASPTDGTSDFTQDGVLSWSEEDVAGWRPVTFQQSGIEDIVQKYGIRVDLSSYTGGSATINRLRRYYKVFAANGTELAFKLDFHEVPAENVTEDLILREISGTWTACTWYRNISVQRVVQLILAEAKYGAGDYDLDDFKLTFDSPQLNIIGQAPAPFYAKKCKALLWDDSNEILYLGIGDELWSVTETGEFKFVDKLEKHNENSAGRGLVEFSIRALALDGTEIHGMAFWDRYDDGILHSGDLNEGFYVRMLKYSGGTFSVLAVSTAQTFGTIGAMFINPAEQHMRKGLSAGSVPNFVTYLGHDDGDSISAGENICIPFPQILRTHRESSTNPVGQVVSDGESFITGTVAPPTFYFGNDWTGKPNSGLFFPSKTNHYFMDQDGETHPSQQWIDFRFRLGNKGLYPYDAGNGFIVYQMERDSGTQNDEDTKIVKLSVDQSLTDIYDFSENSAKQPLFGIIISGFLWFAYMDWDDDGDIPSACILAKIELSTGTLTEIFNFSTDSAETSQSISGEEEVMTILEFAYNSSENTLHGCLLNRENFEYHWFAYDITNDKMYSTQTGSGFTYDKHRQMVDFVLFDEQIFAVCVDRRYQTAQCFLMKGVFSAGSITLSRIGEIDKSYDHLTTHATDDAIFGVTGDGKLWKYGTEFYPRIANANFSDKDLRQVLHECCQAINRILAFRANRTMRLTERDAYDGSKSLYEDSHIVKIESLVTWEHFYDRVEVSWRDPVSGEVGTEAIGNEGWERRVLKIDNPLIQYRQLAAVIAQQYYDFFSQTRDVLSAELVAQLELEEYDRIRMVLKNSNTDIDRDDYYLLTGIYLDDQSLTMRIKGLK